MTGEAGFSSRSNSISQSQMGFSAFVPALANVSIQPSRANGGSVQPAWLLQTFRGSRRRKCLLRKRMARCQVVEVDHPPLMTTSRFSISSSIRYVTSDRTLTTSQGPHQGLRKIFLSALARFLYHTRSPTWNH